MHDSLISTIFKTTIWMDDSDLKERNTLRISILMVIVIHAQTFLKLFEIPNLFFKFHLFHVVWFHYKFLILLSFLDICSAKY